VSKRAVRAVRVGTQSEMANWFETIEGVLQGCVLPSLLSWKWFWRNLALADTEDSGIVVTGSRMSNL